jgi:probable HAF family extracellular repeat protein
VLVLDGLMPGGLGEATAINYFGEVVGFSREQLAEGQRLHPFLWRPTTGTIALGSLGGIHGQATDITLARLWAGHMPRETSANAPSFGRTARCWISTLRSGR